MEGRWTIQSEAPYITGKHSPMVPTPVVPCDDAAIERATTDRWILSALSGEDPYSHRRRIVECVLRAAGEGASDHA